MIIERELIINNSIENAWKVLGIQFADAYKWASVIKHSEGKGKEFNGSSCSARGCDIAGMGKVNEKIITFSEANHTLSYQVVDGMPSMVKYALNTWSLTSVDANKTRLKMTMGLTVGGLMGAIMKPMMKMQMGSMATKTADDFKHFVETGKASEAKLKAIKKFKK